MLKVPVSSQGHECSVYDLDVMGSNLVPSKSKLELNVQGITQE